MLTKLVDQKKQAKLQWLQDQSEVNEASRHLRNKKTEYLKEKTNKLESTVRRRTYETSRGA
jgi:hypothetical protein